MQEFKQAILEIFRSEDFCNLDLRQIEIMHSINQRIEYSWNEWDYDLISPYFEDNKPEWATIEFIEEWIENEDFEAGGFNEAELHILFVGDMLDSSQKERSIINRNGEKLLELVNSENAFYVYGICNKYCVIQLDYNGGDEPIFFYNSFESAKEYVESCIQSVS